jgi:hypothetical protein
MKTTKIIGGYMNTRSYDQDFAITPSISAVNVKSIKGIALTWGYKSIFIALGVNIPEDYPTFDNYTKK